MTNEELRKGESESRWTEYEVEELTEIGCLLKRRAAFVLDEMPSERQNPKLRDFRRAG